MVARIRACAIGQQHRSYHYQHTALQSSHVVRIPTANIYRFGDPNNARPVLRAVDWTVREGESWAVVGSGAGEKTALLEVGYTEHHFSTSQQTSRFSCDLSLCLRLLSAPLSMPLAYARYVDPSREHADISASSWWASPISRAQVASHKRSRISCLVRASTTRIGRCVLRLYGKVWCCARRRSYHAAPKYVP
jgi:hypothetical protein